MSGIPYDVLVQRALRDVVIKEALRTAASPDGLPGEHHFFIRFRTNVLGVQMPEDLKQQYPHEMTVVLRHRFWDLEVTDTSFAVTLTFGGRPASLVIPFGAIVRFEDPSVEFFVELVPTAEPMHVVEEPADSDSDSEDSAAEAGSDSESDSGSGTADVVSLDQFRRK